jgi:hypothetical protein
MLLRTPAQEKLEYCVVMMADSGLKFAKKKGCIAQINCHALAW